MGDRIFVDALVLGGIAVGLSGRFAVFVLTGGRGHHDDVAVFVVEQNGLYQLFKVTVFDLLLDRLQGSFVLEITPWLIVIQPGVGDLDVIVQSLGQSRGVALAQIELGGAELSVDRLAVETRRTFLQTIRDLALDLMELRRVTVAQLDGEQGIGDVLHHLTVQLYRQSFVEDTLFQRIIVGVCEDIGQHGQPEIGLKIRHLADGVGQGDIILAALLTVRRIGAVVGSGLLFDRDLRLLDRFLRLNVAEILTIQKLQLAFYIHLAVEVKARVGGMIMLFVIFYEVVISQLDDPVGMTARYGRILARLVALTEHGVVQDLIGIAQSALHLVVHDALIIELAVLILLDVPALLTKRVLVIVDQRTEHRVGVYGHEVDQILFVHARHGVHRLVGEGHRVEEGVQRAFHQLDKGIVYGVLL